MKNLPTGLIILILVLMSSCGRDLEQAKRYSDIKSETDRTIKESSPDKRATQDEHSYELSSKVLFPLAKI
jgi:hypothetical protein